MTNEADQATALATAESKSENRERPNSQRVLAKEWWRVLMWAGLITLGISGCNRAPSSNSQQPEQTDSSDSEPPKSMTADISGDYTEHFSAKGGAVGIGALGSINKGTARFTIGGLSEGPTQTTDLTIGFIVDFSGFPVGTRQDCVGASVRLLRDGDETDYSDQFYGLFYETRPDAPPVAHVTFSKADKLPHKLPPSISGLLVRYHLVGTFDFQAAWVPQSQPSEACAQEAVAHAVADSPRHPMYRADLCQAKKIVVRGSFDIIQDFPTSFFE